MSGVTITEDAVEFREGLRLLGGNLQTIISRSSDLERLIISARRGKEISYEKHTLLSKLVSANAGSGKITMNLLHELFCDKK